MLSLHRVLFGLALLGSATLLDAQRPQAPAIIPDSITYVPAEAASYRQFASATETMLEQDVLGVWYPRSIDAVHGGFTSDFARDWECAAKPWQVLGVSGADDVGCGAGGASPAGDARAVSALCSPRRRVSARCAMG